MAKVHGLAFLVVGIATFTVSWIVDKERMVFFIYLSFVFIIIGIGKLIFWKRKPAQQMSIQKQKTQQQTKQKQQSQKQQSHALQFKRCLRCHNLMQLTDRFCSKCGARALR